MENRSPIVVVLGHVDHGKTSLLDAIRKTSVAAREAGGITQSIGASVVNGICFIDTPGHAAFTKMRGRGANVADIAVLVVASTEGVKPQTKEAVGIIRDANIPFIVAATKIDMPSSNPELVRGELEKEGILFEGRGGEVPFVTLSAKTGENLNNLLETIKLVSEVQGIKADPEGALEATVIESFKDRRGVVANIVVRNGKLSTGENTNLGKVRAIFNANGETVKEVLPGEPAQVIGFSTVPEVGTKLTKGETEVKVDAPRKVLGTARRVKEDELPIILKAENAGSLEAIIASLPPKVVVVGSGIGDVNETDIMDAKVGGGAYVFVFEAKVPGTVSKLAEAEGVNVKRFEIIYELLQEIDEILKKGKVEEIGKAEVLAIFPYENKKVAGCKMIMGRISKGDKLIIKRNDAEIGKGKASSMRKGKNEITQAIQGEEFGVIVEPQLDFNKGDMLVSVRNG